MSVRRYALSSLAVAVTATITTIAITVLCVLLLHRPALSAPAAPPDQAGHEYRNVIFLSVDTLRSDHLGCYGYERDTSPNIDRLAADGVLFENFIGQAILTPVSQMSIFTSQYPRVNGMTSFAVNVEDVTKRRLPQILKYYGYTNASFLSSREFTRQFTSLSGHEIQTGNIFSDSFDVYEEHRKYEEFPGAMEWIRNNRDRKFFVWISASTVHWPFGQKVPRPGVTMFDGPAPSGDFAAVLDEKAREGEIYGTIPYSTILSRIYGGEYYRDFAPRFRLAPEDIDFIHSRYDAGIHHTDRQVGRLLDLLDELDLTEKTLIVFHSIHGEDLGEHGYFNHYDLYDTEVKNALVVRFPRSRFGGKRVSNQVRGIDLVPTLLDYLEIPVPHEAMGTSLLPLVKDGDAAGLSEFAYSDRIPLWEIAVAIVHSSRASRLFFHADTEREKEAHDRYLEMLIEHTRAGVDDPPYDIAVRTRDWKLILRRNRELLEKISWWRFITGREIPSSEVELYNLREDPLEQENVASRHPDVAARLKENLLEWNDMIESRRVRRSDGDGSPSIIPYP